MPFIKSKCPTCLKTAEADTQYTIAGKVITKLKCGHILTISTALDKKDASTLISIDQKRLFPYQVQGVEFLERADGTAAIFDEMRLGKTVQFMGFLALHLEKLPFLLVCKANLLTQMQRETVRWMGIDHIAQVISDSKTPFLPGMSGYIVSYDLLRRLSGGVKKNHSDKFFFNSETGKYEKKTSQNKLVAIVKQLGIKTLVVDECQQIKNSQSARTMEVKELREAIPNFIALSGTPILNHAGEFFPVLNMLDPVSFNNETRYLTYDVNRYGGLADEPSFRRKTRNIIIRRTRSEVMPDMPKIFRSNFMTDLSKEVEEAYKIQLEKFMEEYESDGTNFAKQNNILKYITEMRHLVGKSKINPTIEYTMEFLASTDRRIVIFTHHIDVAEILYLQLLAAMKELGMAQPLRIESGTTDKQSVVDKFQNGESRVLIAATLVVGEGTTLNKCGDFIMMERQWNPGKEEQAESRFPHVESEFLSISGTYMVAVGTIDEFFAEIVERKREVVGSTLDGSHTVVNWSESGIMQELQAVLAANGRKRWRL